MGWTPLDALPYGALTRGRDFTTTHVGDAQPVVVINQSMARAYFAERDPIGRRIAWTDPR